MSGKKALTEVFENHQQLTLSLLQALKKEQKVLENASADELNDIVEQKNQLLKQLEGAATRLNEQLSAANLPQTDTGIAALISQQVQSEQEQCRAYWQNLKQLLKDCQQQNEINGTLMALGKQQLDFLVTALKGGSDEATTYDAQGEAVSHNNQGSTKA